MTIEEACHAILGDEAAHGIIADMGVHWAVVAAMSVATTADDPEALAAIRDHLANRTLVRERDAAVENYLFAKRQWHQEAERAERLQNECDSLKAGSALDEGDVE